MSTLPLDWIGTGLSVIGVVFCARKMAACWYIWLASNLVWCAYAIPRHLWALVVLNLVFLVTNVYGWRKWHKARTPDLLRMPDREFGEWLDDDQYYA